MATVRILIVDDELIMRESLAGWLQRDGHAVDTAASGEAALEMCRTVRYDILLVDIKMEGISGLEVLQRIKETDPDTAVIMITAYGSIATAIEAMKNGAHDYLMKPFDPNELGVLIEKIVHSQAQARENRYLREAQRQAVRFESMLGQSEAMQRVFGLIRDVAPTETTVLITGETGTGKGLAAKAIHANSPRSLGPFVAVNCGAVPEHLMESELFGHQKGAFTDAKETRRGRLELAHGGTLFLDEVGEISMRMQIDLLRVLEDGRYYRVGGTQALEADSRVIAATNRDLVEAIASRCFREDLYYRLNVFTLPMPSLKDRKEDIPVLSDHFLQRFTAETNKAVDGVDRTAMDELMLHSWPGNVRELENAIERAVVVCKGRRIMPGDLPIACAGPVGDRPVENSLQAIERTHIGRILRENRWNISRSARILAIDRSTLYSKIRRYGLDADQ